MKLNNKGFAISSIMYLILILVIILITVTLSILGSRKLIIDKTKDEVLDNIYNVENITYREVLSILKEEAITYAVNNSIENDSILINDLNSIVEKEILNNYKLSNKYLRVLKKDNSYNVYLGESKKFSNINEPINGLIDIIDYNISGNSVQNGTPTPTNPVDILSVGDYDDITGKYVIPITVSGKNLMNTTSANINGGTKTIIENGFNLVPTNKKGGETYSNSYGRFHSSNYSNKDLYLEAGTYTISYNIKIIEPSEAGSTTTSSFLFASDSKTEIGSTMANLDINLSKGTVKHTFKLTTPKWITYALRLNGMTVEITNMQLEKGSEATHYEPYVEPITHNIYLDEPLRKIDNYVDYIDFNTGTIVRNIAEAKLTGKENWAEYKSTDTYKRFITRALDGKAKANMYNKVYSNYFKGTNTLGTINGIRIASGTAMTEFYLEPLDFDSLATFKSWASSNNIIVNYILNTTSDPQIIDLTNLYASDGHSIISIDSSVSPSSVEFTIIKKIKQL